MTKHGHRLNRKDVVKKYINESRRQGPEAAAAKGSREKPVPPLSSLSLRRTFAADDHRLSEPTEEEIRAILVRTNKFVPADELNCKACGYDTCRDKGHRRPSTGWPRKPCACPS